MNSKSALLGLFVVLTIAFASTTIYDSTLRSTLTRTATSTTVMSVTSTFTSFSTTTYVPPTSGTVFLLDVNGTYYWAEDISNDITIGSPGYSYFLNGSVTFDGVKFQTICPSIYRGCPGSNSSSAIMYAGAIQFNMLFPDGTNETVGGVIGDLNVLYVFSQHSHYNIPIAGMLIEYVNDYPHNPVGNAVFLLVSSCGGPPNFC